MSYLDNTGLAYLWSKIKTAFAAKSHTHAASDITSGTLGVARGGTGGTTALDARKNLSVPVDSSIAYVESTTATKNHAVGDYFMLWSVLMKATAAIATGEQITTSKATPVTVQSQIDTLRDSVSRTVYSNTSMVTRFALWETGMQMEIYTDSSRQNGFKLGANTDTNTITFSQITDGVTTKIFSK